RPASYDAEQPRAWPPGHARTGRNPCPNQRIRTIREKGREYGRVGSDFKGFRPTDRWTCGGVRTGLRAHGRGAQWSSWSASRPPVLPGDDPLRVDTLTDRRGDLTRRQGPSALGLIPQPVGERGGGREDRPVGTADHPAEGDPSRVTDRHRLRARRED